MTVFTINDKNTLLDASLRYVQQESSVFLVILKTGTILTTLAVEIELMIQRNLITSFHGDIAIDCLHLLMANGMILFASLMICKALKGEPISFAQG